MTATVPQDLHQQLDQAESDIRVEQQKRATAEEVVGDMRDQLSGVKSALGSQVMQLDKQCTQLQTDKVRMEGEMSLSLPCIG